MGHFDSSDILKIAVRIEENGSTFYRYAAQISKGEDAKETFSYLAGEEEKHRTTFEGLLSSDEGQSPPESYPGEYASYLHDYADGKLVFSTDKMSGILGKINDTASALDFAISRELDSILYYHEIKRFISKNRHEAIDKIIEEERKHFEKLSAIRKKYKK